MQNEVLINKEKFIEESDNWYKLNKLGILLMKQVN